MAGFKFDLSIFGPFTLIAIVQKCVAEFLGTFLLVFIGCMPAGFTLISPHIFTESDEYRITTFNFGLAVMVPVLIVGHISLCNINPAVSVTMAIIKLITPALAGLYVIFQVLGASAGYATLYGLTPMIHNSSACVTRLHPDISVFQGTVMEALATAVLCFVVCGCFDKRNEKNTDAIALKFGFTVTCIAYAEGAWTSGSLNPARSFGPALITGDWKDHWVYWVGPLIGGAFAGTFYRFVFFIPNEPAEKPEA